MSTFAAPSSDVGLGNVYTNTHTDASAVGMAVYGSPVSFGHTGFALSHQPLPPGRPAAPCMVGLSSGHTVADDEKDREIDRLKGALRKAEEKNDFLKNQVMSLQQQLSAVAPVAPIGAKSDLEMERLRSELREEKEQRQALQQQLQKLGNSMPRSNIESVCRLDVDPVECRGSRRSVGNPLDPLESPGGSKRAVIVGCDYPGQAGALRAGVADARQWAKFFMKRCHFHEVDIRLLTDDPAHYQQRDRPDCAIASRDALLRALRWLTEQSSSGDQLFFVFCGHGVQVVTEERGGHRFCEVGMAPTDVLADHQPRILSDTDVHKALARVPSGVQVTLIQDCCHAGQPLDRDALWRLTEYVDRGKVDYEKLRGPVLPRFLEVPRRERPRGGEAEGSWALRCRAVQWTACANKQFCVELPIEDRHRGVFTYLFISSLLRLGPQASLAELMSEMDSLTSQLKGRWRLQQDVQMSVSGQTGSQQLFLR